MRYRHITLLLILVPALAPPVLANGVPGPAERSEAGAAVRAEEAAESAASPAPSWGERLWRFTGVFHPATVHFPIVLLVLAAALVVLRAPFRSIPPSAAFYALLFGAVAAVVAAAEIAPYNSDMSFLYDMVSSKDASEVMPPEEQGGPLSPLQVERIRRWIEQGAKWPDGVVLRDRSDAPAHSHDPAPPPAATDAVERPAGGE